MEDKHTRLGKHTSFLLTHRFCSSSLGPLWMQVLNHYKASLITETWMLDHTFTYAKSMLVTGLCVVGLFGSDTPVLTSP